MKNKVMLEKNATTYVDYTFKIKVEENGEGNYRIYLKAPDLMGEYVDITNQATDEFQQKLFANFFKKKAS